ncbi:FAD-dependent oxidoreductase [Methanorbis rubei]|uniref:Ferredoxin--NADP reductase n=1 Tax=Methanorbis rubei TaxID=3028300 RepID=A0AAE4MF37_9EURY|nr:Ferredoxin--NADP reductase [Methanocorpusculaceae archaeon Cs1]
MSAHDITIYSTKNCPHCNNLKQWLDEKGISYRSVDVGKDVDAAREMIDLTGQRGVPVIVIDGEVVVGFDRRKIEPLLSIDKTGHIPDDHELIIVGSGAAGLSAAMYAGRKEIETLVIGGARGGMAARSSEIENYPGFYQISGESLMNLFVDQAESYGGVIFDDVVTGFSKSDEKFLIETLSGRTFTADAVIAALGRSPRLSGALGEEEYFGRGVSICTTCDGPLFKGKEVAVYGGGNTAVDMALELSDVAAKVTLISRSALKADELSVDRLRTRKNVVIETGSVITALHGDKTVRSVDIALASDMQNVRSLAIDGLFLGLGLTPNTAVFKGQVAMNASGEIVVDENCRTNVPGLFAAGDATSVESKQVGVAAGEGIKASLAAYSYLKKRSL